ncbi:hypothetical protein H2201_007623 [Coniosporium apollinis]|uniref:Uncharacterized protein n=1 Tax=Coniosporium apollinis TaxID=61459 RepID=A0ABQ9NM00_9PEZI|nr:hypothetical protein H2201_007623 [Coniosporium apollinis]
MSSRIDNPHVSEEDHAPKNLFVCHPLQHSDLNNIKWRGQELVRLEWPLQDYKQQVIQPTGAVDEDLRLSDHAILQSLEVVRAARELWLKTMSNEAVASHKKADSMWCRIQLESTSAELDAITMPPSGLCNKSDIRLKNQAWAAAARSYGMAILESASYPNKCSEIWIRHERELSDLRERTVGNSIVTSFLNDNGDFDDWGRLAFKQNPSLDGPSEKLAKSQIVCCVFWKTASGRDAAVQLPAEDLNGEWSTCLLFPTRIQDSHLRVDGPTTLKVPTAGLPGIMTLLSDEADDTLLDGKYHMVSADPERDEGGEGEHKIH